MCEFTNIRILKDSYYNLKRFIISSSILADCNIYHGKK